MRRPSILLAGLVAISAGCEAFGESASESKTPSTFLDGGGSEGGVIGEGGAHEDAGAPPDGAVAQTFSDVVRQIPGLVGYWHLDEGGNGPPTDVAGGNQGSYQPVVASEPGLLPGAGDAGATRFSSGALAISSGDLSSLRTFDQALTVGALVRVEKIANDQMVVFKYGIFGLGIAGDGNAFLDVQRGLNLARFPSSTKVTAGVTALVVGSFELANNGSVRIWVNGVLTSASGQPTLTVGTTANNQTLCIGGSTGAGGLDCRSSAFGLVGTLDEVFIANQAVSADTVEKLAQLAGL